MAILVKIPTRVGVSRTIYMAIFNPSSWVSPGLKKCYLARMVDPYKHSTAKGLPFMVIQPRADANRVKRPDELLLVTEN